MGQSVLLQGAEVVSCYRGAELSVSYVGLRQWHVSGGGGEGSGLLQGGLGK